MAENEALFLQYQAERCRWLASQSSEPKIMVKLGNMAREYEAQAAKLNESSAHGAPGESAT